MRAAAKRCALLIGLLGAGFAAAATPDALTVRSSVQPRFPLSLRGTNHSDGHAVVALTIDSQGRVDDAVALEASHADFAREAESAVRQWQYEPSAAGTRPPRDVVQFEFRSAGVVSTLTHADAARRSLAGQPLVPELRTLRWSELDAPPDALVATQPRLTTAALARIGAQPVIVSFVIDTAGVVHVPVVDGSVDDEVALAVLRTVRRWRFTPPEQAGKPVLVQAFRAFGGKGEKR